MKKIGTSSPDFLFGLKQFKQSIDQFWLDHPIAWLLTIWCISLWSACVSIRIPGRGRAFWRLIIRPGHFSALATSTHANSFFGHYCLGNFTRELHVRDRFNLLRSHDGENIFDDRVNLSLCFCADCLRLRAGRIAL